MFNPLKGLGDLNKLRQQASAMQKALAQEEIIIEKDGIRIVMSGDQKIKELIIDGAPAQHIAKVVEEALRKTQAIAAQKMISMGMGS